MRRNLTVSALRRQNGHVYRNSFSETFVPSIRLNGNWLAQAGFNTGDKVNVAVADRTLTITPEVRS